MKRRVLAQHNDFLPMIRTFAACVFLFSGMIPSAVWSTSSLGPSDKKADITGFRSATFDMNSKDVLKAIRVDFDTPEPAVSRSVHPTERTELLSIAVDELLPVGGRARITYIIGFRSKTLSQVNVVWGKLADSESSREELLAAGNLLAGYFSVCEFPPEQTIMNQPMSDGSIVLFKGSDRAKHTILLRLLTAPRSSLSEEAIRGSDHDSLMLSYLREPENPDVFRIEPGKF